MLLNARLNVFIEHLRTPVYRNGYALIASTGITSLLGLVYWAIAAKLYDTEHVGLNYTAISVMIFLSGISQINLQETMIRFIPQAGKQTFRLVVYGYGIIALLSIIVGILFCLGISLWSPALSFLVDTPGGIFWFVLAIIVWGVFVVEDSVLIGLRQALWVPLENAVFSVLKIGLLFVLALSFAQTGIFISWTVSVALIIVPINYLIFRRLIPHHVEQSQSASLTISIRQLTRYIAGNYVAALLSSMSSALLPVLITQVAGATANAHFSIAWIIGSALQIVTANMATSMTVEAAADTNTTAEGFRRRALLSIGRLVIPMAVILIVGAPVILQIVGESYGEEGALLLQLLALAAIPNIFNMVHVAMARILHRMKDVIAVYGINAVLVLGLSAIFIPTNGISGVGVAWLISQTVIALMLIVLPRLSRGSSFSTGG